MKRSRYKIQKKPCPDCLGGYGIKEQRLLPGGATFTVLHSRNCETCGGTGHLMPKTTFRSKHKEMIHAECKGKLMGIPWKLP